MLASSRRRRRDVQTENATIGRNVRSVTFVETAKNSIGNVIEGKTGEKPSTTGRAVVSSNVCYYMCAFTILRIST